MTIFRVEFGGHIFVEADNIDMAKKEALEILNIDRGIELRDIKNIIEEQD